MKNTHLIRLSDEHPIVTQLFHQGLKRSIIAMPTIGFCKQYDITGTKNRNPVAIAGHIVTSAFFRSISNLNLMLGMRFIDNPYLVAEVYSSHTNALVNFPFKKRFSDNREDIDQRQKCSSTGWIGKEHYQSIPGYLLKIDEHIVNDSLVQLHSMYCISDVNLYVPVLNKDIFERVIKPFFEDNKDKRNYTVLFYLDDGEILMVSEPTSVLEEQTC